ncbi:hypothetical protein KCU81_g6922, partial [Aureobasidium melanogenum]
SQLKTGHPVRSAIHKQLNGRLVLRWVTTWESLLLYVLHFDHPSFCTREHIKDVGDTDDQYMMFLVENLVDLEQKGG